MDNEQGTTEQQGSQESEYKGLSDSIQKGVEIAEDMGMQLLLIAMLPKMLKKIYVTHPEIYYVSKDKLKNIANMWDKCLTNLENGLEKLD